MRTHEEVPFTEMHPGSPDDDAELDRALEEVPPKGVGQEAQRAAGPDLGRLATPAPKPTRGIAQNAAANDPRFAEFWEAWPVTAGRKRDRTADLLRYWRDYRVSESPRFEHTMAALEAKKKSQDWLRTDKDCIPAPAAWVNSQPWIAAELMPVLRVVPDRPNPYADRPWWQLWAKFENPQNQMGVMNFAAEAAPDLASPYKAAEILALKGFEAAVEYVINCRNAG